MDSQCSLKDQKFFPDCGPAYQMTAVFRIELEKHQAKWKYSFELGTDSPVGEIKIEMTAIAPDGTRVRFGGIFSISS